MNEIVPFENDIAIRCEGLSKSYGEIKALNDLNLEVTRGSIFGFLGRNGAGKTTAIRLLTGLADPTTGKAFVDGLEITNGSTIARERFGYLPQNPAFYNWMTPLEFLDYIGGIFAIPNKKRKKRIQEVLSLVGLQDAARRKIAGFSGGMIQRLGIAQAIIHEPPVLFLDEPTSALDPAGRYEVLELIDSLRGEVTVFLSSHILVDIEKICDTLGVIHKGDLLFVSSRDELLSQYAVDAIELSFDLQAQKNLNEFVSTLRDLEWISEIKQDNGDILVMVSDVDKAKKEMLQMVVAHNLILERYEWVKPSLEDIFLQVSTS
ncbi:MAG: ABC transporter ATP-binding protein [Anaerolineaceae bacterium]|nr:ABC transporter ATP-binding protein [Anaerolineaceae bacterium]